MYCHLGGVIEVIETEDVTFNGVGDVTADDHCKEPLEDCREPLTSSHRSYLRTFCNGRESCNNVNAERVYTTDCSQDTTDVEQVTYMCLDGQSMFYSPTQPTQYVDQMGILAKRRVNTVTTSLNKCFRLDQAPLGSASDQALADYTLNVAFFC